MLEIKTKQEQTGKNHELFLVAVIAIYRHIVPLPSTFLYMQMSPSCLQHNEPRPSGHVWFCTWCPEWGSTCLNFKSRHLANDEWNLGLNMFILRHLPTFREVCRKWDEYWRCQENWDLSCSTAPRLLPRHSWWYTEIQWEELALKIQIWLVFTFPHMIVCFLCSIVFEPHDHWLVE